MVTSLVVAFFLIGFATVVSDFNGRAIDRPTWTFRPTIGKAFTMAATWFVRPFIETYDSTGSKVRALVMGLAIIALRLSVVSTLIWSAIHLSQRLFDSSLAVVACAAVLIVVGAMFILPLVNLLLVPLTLLLVVLLNFILPSEVSAETSVIRWCRTCRHHRQSGKYEDIMRGTWRSRTLPELKQLPCAMIAVTGDTWRRFYALDPEHRALFPKDCSAFEWRH